MINRSHAVLTTKQSKGNPMSKIVRRPDYAGGGITEAEKAAMDEHAKLWIARAMRTDPIEPDKITAAIGGLYAAAGLATPPRAPSRGGATMNISTRPRQPGRSLAELREETVDHITVLADRLAVWQHAILSAGGEEHDTLGVAIDLASDELAALEDRLDQLDDEMGNRRDDDPGMPLVL